MQFSRGAKSVSGLGRFSHSQETYMRNEVDPSCCGLSQCDAVKWEDRKTPGDTRHILVASGWCELSTRAGTR